MIKNQAGQLISFLMLSATDGSGVNTGTTYVGLMKDGSAPVAATNSPFHKSNGSWTLSLTQAETNCDHLLAVMTISGAITSMTQVYTVDPANFKADVSGLATSTDISDIKGSGWSATTDTLQLIRDRVDLGITLTATVSAATDKLDSTLVYTGSGSIYKFTTDALSNAPTGGTAPTASEIYTEFTTGSNADAFKANVSSLATSSEVSSLNDLSASDVASAVWDADYTNHTTTNSFGDKVLLAQSSHRLVQVDANHNVHSAVHIMEIDSFTAAAIASDAVTEIQAGLATASELSLVPKTGTAYTHTNQAGDTMTVTIT